jgi:hypothetical protein
MSGTHKELISKAEFARRAGLSRARVDRLVADGLPLEDGKVAQAKALAWIEANIDPVRKDNWQNGSLNDLRRERERVKIEQQKLELAKARGELVERARPCQPAVALHARPLARCRRGLRQSLGADHGRLFAALEEETRTPLRYLAEKPLEGAN